MKALTRWNQLQRESTDRYDFDDRDDDRRDHGDRYEDSSREPQSRHEGEEPDDRFRAV